MAVRLYANEYIKLQLKQRGCEKLKDYETCALWRTAKGFHFIVPQEGQDRRCDEYTFREVLAEIEGR